MAASRRSRGKIWPSTSRAPPPHSGSLASNQAIASYKFPTIVIVLDNGGYGTERFLHPGNFEFNNIQPWAYHKLPEVYGGGRGYLVRTEGDFDAALREALADRSNLSLIHVVLDKNDRSTSLERLTEKLSKRV